MLSALVVDIVLPHKRTLKQATLLIWSAECLLEYDLAVIHIQIIS